jgi:hypothetical protein
MSIQKVYPNGLSGALTIPAAESIAVRSTGGAVQVYRTVGYPNFPDTRTLVGTVADGTETVYGPYASGATIEIEAEAGGALYAIGVGPKVGTAGYVKEVTVGTLNATGTLTAALISGGIVTSTTASAVTATLDTGTVMDAALDLAIGEGFEWSAINTGGSNAFTVTAATGHTVVGTGVAVAANTSQRFLTKKTAANTFVTYTL